MSCLHVEHWCLLDDQGGGAQHQLWVLSLGSFCVGRGLNGYIYRKTYASDTRGLQTLGGSGLTIPLSCDKFPLQAIFSQTVKKKKSYMWTENNIQKPRHQNKICIPHFPPHWKRLFPLPTLTTPTKCRRACRQSHRAIWKSLNHFGYES